MKCTTILATLLICTSALHAEISPYLGFAIGAVAAKDADYSYQNQFTSETGKIESKAGAVIEAAFGIDLDTLPFRVEAAASLLANEFESVSSDTLNGSSVQVEDTGIVMAAFMINGYLDIPTGTLLEPYIFAGIGRATVFQEVRDNEDSEDDRVGAVQAGAGLGIALTDFFLLDLKYRYFTTDDYTITYRNERLEAEFASHQFIGGIRIRF
jgi:opacity protein-like surface antigen